MIKKNIWGTNDPNNPEENKPLIDAIKTSWIYSIFDIFTQSVFWDLISSGMPNKGGQGVGVFGNVLREERTTNILLVFLKFLFGFIYFSLKVVFLVYVYNVLIASNVCYWSVYFKVKPIFSPLVIGGNYFNIFSSWKDSFLILIFSLLALMNEKVVLLKIVLSRINILMVSVIGLITLVVSSLDGSFIQALNGNVEFLNKFYIVHPIYSTLIAGVVIMLLYVIKKNSFLDNISQFQSFRNELFQSPFVGNSKFNLDRDNKLHSLHSVDLSLVDSDINKKSVYFLPYYENSAHVYERSMRTGVYSLVIILLFSFYQVYSRLDLSKSNYYDIRNYSYQEIKYKVVDVCSSQAAFVYEGESVDEQMAFKIIKKHLGQYYFGELFYLSFKTLSGNYLEHICKTTIENTQFMLKNNCNINSFKNYVIKNDFTKKVLFLNVDSNNNEFYQQAFGHGRYLDIISSNCQKIME